MKSKIHPAFAAISAEAHDIGLTQTRDLDVHDRAWIEAHPEAPFAWFASPLATYIAPIQRKALDGVGTMVWDMATAFGEAYRGAAFYVWTGTGRLLRFGTAERAAEEIRHYALATA